MTKIEKVLLPSDEKGNDASAHRGDKDIWAKVEIELPDASFDAGELPANIDTLTIKPRPFIVSGRLLRGAVSCIAGPPGVGKSAFEIATMVSIASGHPYLGEDIIESGKTWLFNNEEDRDELLRRYIGFCRYYGITPSSLRDKFYLSSGYGKSLIVAKKDARTGEVFAVPSVVDELIQLLKDRDISVLSVDPIVSTHLTDENSNIDAEQVMGVWRHIAGETNCAINLPAHISKLGRNNESDSFAGNLDAIRGASAVAGAARQIHTLARMGPATSKAYGIDDELRLNMVRLDAAKGNYSPPVEKSTWLQMRGQCLDNHETKPDWVGVFTEYQGEMIKAAGKRDQNDLESESALKLALQKLDLKRGESLPVREVIEKLINSTGKSDSWIFAKIPIYLNEHLSTNAEKDEAEFTWEKKKKKTGGKAQLFIHREIHV